MPIPIMDASLSDRLRKFFKLKGRTQFALDESVVPTAMVQDLTLPFYPQRWQYFEGYGRLTGAVDAGDTRAFTISVEHTYAAFQTNILGPGEIVRQGGLALITDIELTNLERGGPDDIIDIAIVPSPFNWMWNSGVHQVIQRKPLSVNRWTPHNATEAGANPPDKVPLFLQGTNNYTLAFAPGDDSIADLIELEEGERASLTDRIFVLSAVDQLGFIQRNAVVGTEGWSLHYRGLYDPQAGA